MSRLARYLLLALVVSVSGCRDNPSGPSRLTILDCESGSTYSIGRTVNGLIDDADCLDPAGDAFADYYQFRVGAEGPVSVSVNTLESSTSLVIALIDEELNIIDFDEFSPGGSGLLAGELPAGDYYVVVAADQAGDGGRYTMTSSNSIPAAFTCDLITPITIGATVQGAIAATDCLDPIDAARADYFDFTLQAPAAVSVRVTPGDASTLVVGLSTSRGFFLDVVTTTQQAPSTIGGMLQPGRYVVIVAGTDAAQTGSYTIVTSPTLPPIAGVPPFLGCLTPQPYTIGTVASGSLARTDCIDGFDTPVDRYDFTLAATTRVTFDLRSVSFDPFLTLFNENGGLIAYDDDAGEGYDARITATLPAGKYALGATGYYDTSLGDYTLGSVVGADGAVVANVCGAGDGCSQLAASFSSQRLAAGCSQELLAARCLRRDGSAWRTADTVKADARLR